MKILPPLAMQHCCYWPNCISWSTQSPRQAVMYGPAFAVPKGVITNLNSWDIPPGTTLHHV
jgi:hypothetical protein